MEWFWSVILDICYLSVFLFIAVLLRARIPWLQKFLVPNNILAGFLGLLCGQEFLGFVTISQSVTGPLVYHLLAITFIAMGLRHRSGSNRKSVVASGFILSFGYILQAVVGLTIAVTLTATVYPKLFPTFGYFLLLGFGQGPGQAYAIGSSWESAGFANAGNIGLTFAAIGYLWSCFVGIPLVYYRMKKDGNGISIDNEIRTGIVPDRSRQKIAGYLSTTSEAVDGFTTQIMLVALVYLLTYGALKAVEHGILLIGHGKSFVQLGKTLWGFHYIFAAMMAVLVRKILDRLGLGFLTDDGLMTRIAGSSVDYLVTAAIASISIGVFLGYVGPILLIASVGGLLTLIAIVYLVRLHRHILVGEHTAGIFGTMTGTLSTGLALTRIRDPQFQTSVAGDLVFGCAIATPVAAPIMASMMVPLYGLGQSNPMLYYLSTVGGLWFYGAMFFFVWKAWFRKSLG